MAMPQHLMEILPRYSIEEKHSMACAQALTSDRQAIRNMTMLGKQTRGLEGRMQSASEVAPSLSPSSGSRALPMQIMAVLAQGQESAAKAAHLGLGWNS